MATSILLRSARSAFKSTDLATSRFVPATGATAWSSTPLRQRLGSLWSMTRLFSSRAPNDVIGIDFGNTNSRVSIMEGKTVKLIENSEGARTTPSTAAFKPNAETLVGTLARREAKTDPSNTVFAAKRLLGRKYDDPETQKWMKKVPYKIVKASNGDAWVEVNGKQYSPSQIAAIVLAKMKETAEAYLGRSVSKAVITVPSYFNDAQRQATKDAGRIAGLDVQRIINETTSAALSYGLKNKLIVVFHLGGGTFDVSLILIHKDNIQVLATNGDTSLGGEDFDNTLLDYLVSEFKRTESIDLQKDKLALQRLREAAEKAKIDLSFSTQTEINLPFIAADASGAKHLNITLTRSKLEALVNHLIDRIKTPCRNCLKDAGVKVKDIDAVLLVGGMTRVPKVRKVVTSIFGKSPSKGVNPDEAVAMGAAIQGGIFSKVLKVPQLFDVTPRWIGVETPGGVCTLMIPRNATIPIKNIEFYTTTADGQTGSSVLVYGGESDANKSLGQLLGEIELGIPPAPRGFPVVEVEVSVDEDGCLDINVKTTLFGEQQCFSKDTLKEVTPHTEIKSRMLLKEDDLDVLKDVKVKNSDKPLPVNWVTEKAVTAVINQKKDKHGKYCTCGSCWAQAVIAALESLYFIKTGRLVRLSVQQVVDCAVKDGCKGSNAHWAYRFAKLRGICSNADYPYTGHVQKCNILIKPIMKIHGYGTVELSIEKVKEALSRQPLAASYTKRFCRNSIYSDFGRSHGNLFYYNDVVDLEDTDIGHAVCLVGWYYYKGNTVFVVKESQGDQWGVRGFCLLVIRDDVELKKIFRFISYPLWIIQQLSLGVETIGGIFTRLINGKESIPTKKSEVFSTAKDNQTEVCVRVFLGNREIASQNKLLGEFVFTGIPPAPRGLPQIEVTFDIDANGIVTVSAKDKQSGKQQQIAVKSSGGLSDSEIERMVRDAELHSQKDQEWKMLIEVKNSADTSIHSMEKFLSGYTNKIPEEVAKEIEDAISDLRQASAGDNVDEISAKLDIAIKAISKIGHTVSGGSSGGHFLF